MLAASGADKTVTDKEHGFEITFPETWTVGEKLTGRIKAKAAAPFAEGTTYIASVTVVVADVKQDTVLKDYVDNDMIPFGRTFKNYELSDSVKTKISDADAYAVTFFLDQNEVDLRLKCVIYYLVAGRRSYTITFVATKVDYPKFAKDIDAIVKLFKLLEAK